MTNQVIEIAGLRKVYRVGFLGRAVEGVKNVTFDVREGEIVGLVGPNGSGKTTTLKVLLGLCQPTAGSARIHGLDARDPQARARVGFLPESPYIYPYLTPREFVDLAARLSGVAGSLRDERVAEVLGRTGIAYAKDRPVRRLSKGMLQRTGLAAALVANPDLLVLDEPMSGLDPLGRREVRELILEERRQGKTVLFSSHVLSDVEALCDRVVILRKGEVVLSGAVDSLVHRGATITELTLRGLHAEAQRQVLGDATSAGKVRLLHAMGEQTVLEVEGEDALHAVVSLALAQGASLTSAIPRKDSLEDLFFRQALREEKTEDGGGADALA